MKKVPLRTIAEFLERNFRLRASARLIQLGEIGAPAALMDELHALVQGDGGLSHVGKIAQFGQARFVSFEQKKYRRGSGVTFALPDGSHVYFIPGPFGPFLTDEEET